MHELDASLIKSPLDGMVVDLKKHVGEVVQAGEKFGEIINLEKLYVEGFMPANYAWNVTTGKPFQAYSTFEKPAGMTQPATIYAGTILMVHPEIDDISKTVRFVGIVKNHDNMLRSGLPMKLQIEISPNSR